MNLADAVDYGFDPSRQCKHRNEQGRCPSAVVWGEDRCPAHSDSRLAVEMRERVAAREARSPLSSPSPTYAAGVTFAALSRDEARRRRREQAQDDVYKMIFKGDITTGEGMIRLTERLLREFAAGKLPHRRFDAMLRALRFIAMLRRRFPAASVDEPPEQTGAPTEGFVVVHADQRPESERAEELDRVQAKAATRQEPERSVAVVATAASDAMAEAKASAAEMESAAAGDDKAKILTTSQTKQALVDSGCKRGARRRSKQSRCSNRRGLKGKRASRGARNACLSADALPKSQKRIAAAPQRLQNPHPRVTAASTLTPRAELRTQRAPLARGLQGPSPRSSP